MRVLVVCAALALLFILTAPPFLINYVASIFTYAFSFRWLRDIRLLVQPWVWVTKNCGWSNGVVQLIFMHMAMVSPYIVQKFKCNEGFLRFVIILTATHCAFYTKDIVTEYALCDRKGRAEGVCESIIQSGVNSVSLFEWWVDGLVIHWVTPVWVILEGWRVRMDLGKTLLYALFSGSYFVIVSLPLFVLEWRNYKRINDVIYNLYVVEKPDESPILRQALEEGRTIRSVAKDHVGNCMGAAPYCAHLHASARQTPTASPSLGAVAPMSPSPPRTPRLSQHDSAIAEVDESKSVESEAVAAAATPSQRSSKRKKKQATPKKSSSVPTDSSEAPTQVLEDQDTEEEKSSETGLRRRRGAADASTSTETQVVASSANADSTIVLSPLASPTGSPRTSRTSMRTNRAPPSLRVSTGVDAGTTTGPLTSRLPSDMVPPELSSDTSSWLDADAHPTPEEIENGTHQYPYKSNLHELSMRKITKAYWAAGGLTRQQLMNNPSPVNVRAFPTILKHSSFSLPLQLLAPVFFLVVGIGEIWTWMVWMDRYLVDHCWLAGFFDYIFESPSAFMMTTGGWHGLFIWGPTMFMTEPEQNFKYVMYWFMLLNFQNVATLSCFYIVWREFRLRYLPAVGTPGAKLIGTDQSVWVVSHEPDAYFVRPRVKDEMEVRKELRAKIWEGIAVPLWNKYVVRTVTVIFGLIPFLGAFMDWLRSIQPLAMLFADVWGVVVDSVGANWLSFHNWVVKHIRRWQKIFSKAPLPTPSLRRSLLDWSLLMPYLMITWMLSLNAYVLCWYYDLNSSWRQIFSGSISILGFLWVHLRDHGKTRAIFRWMCYETVEEESDRSILAVANPLLHTLSLDSNSGLQTLKAGTGFNFLPIISPQDSAAMKAAELRALHERGFPSPDKYDVAALKGSARSTDAGAQTDKANLDEACYVKKMSLNPHLLWSLSLTLLSLFAAFVTIPDVQFNLPWNTSFYEQMRQNILDSIYPSPGQGTVLQLVLIGGSLALAYPLFFGFSLRGPDRRKGMPYTPFVLKLSYILPLLFVWSVIWNSVTLPCSLPLGVEGPPPSQVQYEAMDRIIRESVRTRATPQSDMHDKSIVHRLVHPKTHGCVSATFSTPYHVPHKFRWGLFEQGQPPHQNVSWKAFVRFSNGALQTQRHDGSWVSKADSVPDVRGMAVKLLQVKGEKALNATELEEYPERTTQDFLAITSDFFFQSNGNTYAEFVAALSLGDPVTMLNWLMPKAFSWKELKGFWARIQTAVAASMMEMQGKDVLNPLDLNYYSAVPYRLGDDLRTATNDGRSPLAVKFRWKPCGPPRPARQPAFVTVANKVKRWWGHLVHVWSHLTGLAPDHDPSDRMTMRERETMIAKQNPENFLRINLQNRLDPTPDPSLPPLDFDPTQPNVDNVCFDLLIQDQLNACQNPIENVEKPWEGMWMPVGRLEIPKQNFLSKKQLDLCENLSYNPWHSLKVHRPLGAINKLRKVAYLAAADERRKLNGVNTPDVRRANYTGDELRELAQADHNISGNAAMYDYADYPSPFEFLPKHIATVPFHEKRTNQTNDVIGGRTIFAIRAQSYPQQKMRLEFERPQDYEYFMLGQPNEPEYPNTNWCRSGRMRRPKLVEPTIWTSDTWWARQFIQGLNPMEIQRVTSMDQLPKALFVHTFDEGILSNIRHVLRHDRASTLAELAKDGRLFVVDFEELEDIMTYGNRVMYAPIVLLYLPNYQHGKGARTLLPLFVQLERQSIATKGNRPRLFFPASPITDQLHMTEAQRVWLFTKMHVSSSDAVKHQMVHHLLDTHLAMEPLIIASHRAFAPTHIIYKTLLMHFTGTIAINDFGRDTLLSSMHALIDMFLAPGLQGSLQLMQKHYNTSTHFMETVPAQLRRRGFNLETARDPSRWGSDADQLPGFLYRDYGIQLWDAMREYVEGVLTRPDGYGKDPKKAAKLMSEDSQLHAWFHEITSDSGAGIKTLRPIHTLSDLIDFVTQIIFQASAQHAAVNFGQYDLQAFQPSRPLFLTKDVPQNLSLVTDEYMLHSLMPVENVVGTLSLFDILSACCVNTLTLDLSQSEGLINPRTTIAPAFPEHYDIFLAKLKQLETLMRKHNEENGYNYPYLYPSRVPASIAI